MVRAVPRLAVPAVRELDAELEGLVRGAGWDDSEALAAADAAAAPGDDVLLLCALGHGISGDNLQPFGERLDGVDCAAHVVDDPRERRDRVSSDEEGRR